MAKGIKGSTPSDVIKTTFNSSYKRIEKFKHVAFMQKRNMSLMINEAIDKIIAKYEEKNGEIPVK